MSILSKEETTKLLDIEEIVAETSGAFWGRACARAVIKIHKLQEEIEIAQKLLSDLEFRKEYENENKWLRISIKKYGEHKYSCSEERQQDLDSGHNVGCTCGLEEALKEE